MVTRDRLHGDPRGRRQPHEGVGDKKLRIFLELMTKGSLATIYHKYNSRDSQVSVYTRQILNGLKYLHDQNVVHKDTKCANIPVDASGSVKLADFGLAKATEMNVAKYFEGTHLWTAPEVFKNVDNRSYGLAADIWSHGCTVLEILTREGQYSDFKPQALEKIRKGEPSPLPKSLSKDARDFIRRCLRRNPKNRPSAAQLLDHPFVKKSPREGCLTTPTLSPTRALSPPQVECNAVMPSSILLFF
ncbi:hypothetical protein EUGRSUZ_G00623 [Eucalyptus grandis]|uniref:Uncharacterized protein n=2 Tax=Eucalyptus grandis TaxID=71139 RepID=A0ACC3K1C2_EUCGR|nr:hypothetical protein EUGRSUZ_G00623 [Eucalyptus grandis]